MKWTDKNPDRSSIQSSYIKLRPASAHRLVCENDCGVLCGKHLVVVLLGHCELLPAAFSSIYPSAGGAIPVAPPALDATGMLSE